MKRLAGLGVAILFGLAPAVADAQQYPPQDDGGISADADVEVDDGGVTVRGAAQVGETEVEVETGVDLDTEGIATHRDAPAGGLAFSSGTVAAVTAAGLLSLLLGSTIAMRQRRSARTIAT
jgi:hypothetical protein